jgi:hypothetical protein
VSNKIEVTARLVFGRVMGLGVAEQDRLYASVIIEDNASGLQIAELRMNPAELMSFMGANSTRMEMEWTSHPERIGRRMEHEMVTVPGSAFKDMADANAGAEAWRTANGWETVEVRRNNELRWTFIGRRWVAATKEN